MCDVMVGKVDKVQDLLDGEVLTEQGLVESIGQGFDVENLE